MACELSGAKLLAPYFGTSLYIWAAVLGLTLGGLTTGYFFGGVLSKKYTGKISLLYKVLIAASLFLIVMPFTSELIMESTINMNLQVGAILSLLVFMVPPLAFMGMVSPILINLLTQESDSAGNNAGNVYAISTVGGILFTFLMGFYIIPEFGIVNPIIWTGVLLGIFPVISLLRSQERLFALVAVIVMSGAAFKSSYLLKELENYSVLYHSEGILGQIKVVDHPAYGYTEDERMGRGLIVNNTLQTFAGLDNNLQYSIWSWAHYIPTAASIFPEKSQALLLGLGGGTIVKQFNRLGFDTDVVEIDERVWEVGKKYFNVPPNTKMHVDDARHFIKTSKKKYNLIVFDTFLSESVPEHLLTIQGFEDTKEILSEDGMIMVNFYGFIEGEKGTAARSVLKTLKASGFHTEILATPGNEKTRNLIFLASREEKNFDTIDYSEPNFTKITDLYQYLLNTNTIDLEDAYILDDNYPRLSKLYAPAATMWKKSYNEYYRKYFGSK